MDSIVRHLHAMPRIMPVGLQVVYLGYLNHKTERVNGTYETVNFSFVLRGQGTLEYKNRTWAIEAPCVFMQWPGPTFRYGADPGTGWDEFFVCYSPPLVSRLSDWNIHPEKEPVWAIEVEHSVSDLIDRIVYRLQRMWHDHSPEGTADRIDRLCEQLLLESKIHQRRSQVTPYDAILETIRAQVSTNLGAVNDFHALAEQHGMSYSTLRRYWLRLFGQSPGRDLSSMRIHAACRMLMETGMEVKEVAFKLGFENPLYFSRCFTRAMGMSPTQYRRKFSHNI